MSNFNKDSNDNDMDFNDDEIQRAREEILEEINNKYFIVATNNMLNFTALMKEENISLDKGMIDGFEIEELQKLFDKFVGSNVTAIFMPFYLMKELSESVNLNRLYTFEPLIGKKRIGVLIPKQVAISEAKPDRQQEINENDSEQLSQMIEALNNGKIDFDTFLKLT